ncbi:MAG: NAD(P)H-dependent oxidoreductase [Patescibacteria group bacterium]|nr:NAD(P)H-dependent oxidoreductase [Patescibacteria group bacterium]
MDKLIIPVVLGTARAERQSEKVARWVAEEMRTFGFETELVDVRDYPLTATVPSWVEDERVRPWRELMTKADGLVIVSPEYNHGYPGELKLLLDTAFKKEYEHKPALICGVSNGMIGGARMIEALRLALLGMTLVPLPAAVHFPNIKDAFGPDGKPKDAEQSGRLRQALEELSRQAEAMRATRKKQ